MLKNPVLFLVELYVATFDVPSQLRVRELSIPPSHPLAPTLEYAPHSLNSSKDNPYSKNKT